MRVRESEIEELRDRLARHPADRYPVQHATAAFHLGVALADAGSPTEAVEVLQAAVRLFGTALPVEQAKARNALGAALRMIGQPGEAAAVFTQAADAFESAGLVAEHGAARFNLGLVLREQGDADAAADAFSAAASTLEAATQPVQAAAATRELAATLLGAGELDAARAALEGAANRTERAGDAAGAGATANLLGLVHLAAGRALDAIEAFDRAAACNPRGVRPEGYAIAKANLALAYEACGTPERARVAARLAAGVPGAPPAVARQAAAVLERVGDEPGALLAVLEQEPQSAWAGLLREEVAWWVDADPVQRGREADTWVAGVATRPVDVAEAWLAALLELPPVDMETVIRASLEAVERRDAVVRERFRARIGEAAGRFHVPQLMRLQETFERIGAEVGRECRSQR